jgi:DNA-directed RNA polymerase subunit omega
MARITSEDAVNKVGNRFDLVLIASQRAKELHAGATPMVKPSANKGLTALREIEEGHVGREYLLKLSKKR